AATNINVVWGEGTASERTSNGRRSKSTFEIGCQEDGCLPHSRRCPPRAAWNSEEA
ncbi:hypothetical protein V3C99_010036, partial [Haemonchus contortus]